MGDDFDEGHHRNPRSRGRRRSVVYSACGVVPTRNETEGFLTTLASSPGVTPSQVEQATDALTILPGSASGQ